jgi:transposase InsO family protein
VPSAKSAPSYSGVGIRDHPTAWRSPWQNGYVERLIGSIRRESLDHLVVFDEAQLHRVLKNYASHYNQVRTHLSLKKNAPDFRSPQSTALSHQYQSSAGFIINTSGFRF